LLDMQGVGGSKPPVPIFLRPVQGLSFWHHAGAYGAFSFSGRARRKTGNKFKKCRTTQTSQI